MLREYEALGLLPVDVSIRHSEIDIYLKVFILMHVSLALVCFLALCRVCFPEHSVSAM